MGTGKLELTNVPIPLCEDKGVMVKTGSSLVSIGTERSIIELANKSLIGKAKARPDLLRRAVEKAKREGFSKVFKESKERLDEPFSLGYSASGIVVEVGKSVDEFSVGDEVAICGGGFANHAEYNFVPENLCVHLPKRGDGKLISFEEGAFGMVGAIALHGIREAQITPGETVLVIGLGLLGLITVQIIRSMGGFAVGVDIDSMKVDLAKGLGESFVFNSKEPGMEEYIFSATGNNGVDATIITAATKGNQPIEVAQKCTRTKGRIVLVGVSDIHLDRKSFWEKELSFSVSRGDGPGMLDENYILKGIDYPVEYVRWTKKRNVEYFLKLVANGSVQIGPLITHRHLFSEAENVYDRILSGDEKCIGVIFDYGHAQNGALDNALRTLTYTPPNQYERKERIVGLIGAGMFAKNILLPEIRKLNHVQLKTIATTRGMTADHIAGKYGFNQSTTDFRNIISDPEIDTVMITTRHDSHAKFVCEAIQAGKNIFVEKPLCLTVEELSQIKETYYSLITDNESQITSNGLPLLMVGYNRRFSPHVADIRAFFEHINEPKVINYCVNAGYIPPDHWTQDFDRGGGRIIGEVCHFVDLCMFLSESKPRIVFAQGIRDGSRFKTDDNLTVNIQFENGSIASIIYTAMGSKAHSREVLEVFSGGSVYHLVDFRKGVKVDHGKTKRVSFRNKDIGHKREMEEFLAPKIKELISFEEIIWGSMATFSIIESLKTGTPINIPEKMVKFTDIVSEAGERE